MRINHNEGHLPEVNNYGIDQQSATEIKSKEDALSRFLDNNSEKLDESPKQHNLISTARHQQNSQSGVSLKPQ